jgi:hypothetical protein
MPAITQNSPDELIEIKNHSKELEYNAIRAEILKRIELRQQIMAVTLTFAGVFLGFGLENETVALIYPPIAMFLAFAWAQNDFRIRDQAQYIREQIEPHLPGMGYETYVQQKRMGAGGMRSWRFVVLSHGGLFLITQILAIIIEVTKGTFNSLEWVLLALDAIAILVVLWLIGESGRKSPKH